MGKTKTNRTRVFHIIRFSPSAVKIPKLLPMLYFMHCVSTSHTQLSLQSPKNKNRGKAAARYAKGIYISYKEPNQGA